MEKLVGIDFGACNIKAAYWRGSDARIVRLSQNADQSYIPNVILYDLTRAGNVEQKIGDAAKNAQDPDNSVEHVKRKLEAESWSKNIPSLQREVSAVDAATDIFRELSERLQKKLNCTPHELRAIITVPVCSSGLQRSRIYQAAVAAGITVEEIITEPFAAMFSVQELLDDEERDEVVLIFDFGGSTLDLSLLRIVHEDGIRIEELASAGFPYGGIDIDTAIYTEIFAPKYDAEIREIISHDDTVGQAKTRQELRDVVTWLKEKLFEEDEESIEHSCTFRGSAQNYTFELTCDEMTELFQRHQLREKIFDLMDELFGQTNLQKDEVTLVRPFGGTSRVKYVLDLLTEYFGADIFDSDEDERDDDAVAGVAVGAARYFNIREERDDIELVIDRKIPLSLGIARGDSFVKCTDYHALGRSIRKTLTWQDLCAKNYKVSVYQCFADSEDVAVGGKDGAVYVGSAVLDPTLYQEQGDPLLEMELRDSRMLHMIFSQVQDDEIQEIERHVIDLRGAGELQDV